MRKPKIKTIKSAKEIIKKGLKSIGAEIRPYKLKYHYYTEDIELLEKAVLESNPKECLNRLIMCDEQSEHWSYWLDLLQKLPVKI